MADRFYSEVPLSCGEFVLEGPEAHHLGTVLRVATGTRVVLFDGCGAEWPATVIVAGKKRITLAVEEAVPANRERQAPLTIAAAMPKGDRGDMMVEKLVELGVTAFLPLVCERSVVVPKPARIETLRRLVVEASKQCGRNVLMQVHEPVKWTTFAKTVPQPGWILHPGEAARPTDPPSLVAIGPEGGFTDAEASMPGWQAVTLGERILRIETAAIAIAAITSL
jgi:16S rRNA (uracil1498-N3)-methyltransferase